MKKQSIYLVLVMLSVGLILFIHACSNESLNVVKEKEPKNLLVYSYDLYGEKITSRGEEQNCCECNTPYCSAKKCCTSPSNCTCFCTSDIFGGSSCRCDACTGSSAHLSYDLWLTTAQFGFWEDFADILDADGSDAADAALEELLNALDAVSTDDFDKFDDSKDNLISRCSMLSGNSKTAINNLLTTHSLEDLIE